MVGPSIDKALAVLLDDTSPSDPPPAAQLVDHVLTTGYAEALDLEAERLMASRRLQRSLRGGPAYASEVAGLTDKLAGIDARLAELRARLAELDARFGAGGVRAARRCV